MLKGIDVESGCYCRQWGTKKRRREEILLFNLIAVTITIILEMKEIKRMALI